MVRSRTLGSGFTLEVCANTTLCINLTQHIRTGSGAVSQISLILVLMAVIFSHVVESYELFILAEAPRLAIGPSPSMIEDKWW